MTILARKALSWTANGCGGARRAIGVRSALIVLTALAVSGREPSVVIRSVDVESRTTWFTWPAPFTVPETTRPAGHESFSHYAWQAEVDRGTATLDEIETQLTQQLRRTRWIEFDPEDAAGLRLQFTLMRSGLWRRWVEPGEIVVWLPAMREGVFAETIPGLVGWRTLDDGKRGVVSKPGIYYAGARGILEVLNSRHEVVWQAWIEASPFDPEARGETQRVLIDSPQRLEALWRKAAIVLGRDARTALSSGRPSLSRAVDSGHAAVELPSEAWQQEMWLWPDARAVRVELPTEVWLEDKSRFGGSVTVVAKVAEDGQVLEATIRGTPPEPVQREVLTAIRKWRFQPARHQGQPVQYFTQRTFEFESETDAD